MHEDAIINTILLFYFQPQKHKQHLAQDVRELFASNAMVAVLSYYDMKNVEWSELIHEVQESDIHFRFLPNKIVHRALDNTPFVNIFPLFISTNVVASSKTIEVKALLEALKSQRKVQLLGGKIHNRLFANEGFSWVSKLPSLEHLHSELSVTLCQPSQGISHLLVKNTQVLTPNPSMVASDWAS